MFKKFLLLFTTLTLSLACVACGKCGGDCESGNANNKTTELTNDVSYIPPMSDKEPSANEHHAYTKFGLELFKRTFIETFDNEKNTLLSPLSVYYALSMLANGADGATLTEIEDTLGMPIEDINKYVYSYMNNLPNTQDYKMHIANSMWIKNNFNVYESYINNNKKYFNAEVFTKPFNNSTCDEVNSWCNDHTSGMIPILYNYATFPRDSYMILINALAFEANWANEYESYNVRKNNFTSFDGCVVEKDFMYSSEDVYLENDSCTGFVKYYKDNKYAFVALLPDEDISISDFINNLTCNDVEELLSNKTSEYVVNASIPKFNSEQTIKNLGPILADMGIIKAFSGTTADFTKISDTPLEVDRIIHKTYINIDEKGTKAAAVTAIEIDGCAPPDFNIQYKDVNLNRPFVYMLIDCENNTPFFIGSITDFQQDNNS